MKSDNAHWLDVHNNNNTSASIKCDIYINKSISFKTVTRYLDTIDELNLTHTLQTEDHYHLFVVPISITLKRRARWPIIDLVSKSATMQWYTSIWPLAIYS